MIFHIVDMIRSSTVEILVIWDAKTRVREHFDNSHAVAEWDYWNVGVVVKYDGLLADGAIPLDMQWSCSMWPSLLLEQ